MLIVNICRCRIKLFVIAIFFFIYSISYADTCITSSGSECLMNCSVGTMSLSCSPDSKTCSGSCSDPNVSLELFLANMIRDIYISSERSVTMRDIFKRMHNDFDEILNNNGKFEIKKRRFKIIIGSIAMQKWSFSGNKFEKSLKKVEHVFSNFSEQHIIDGRYEKYFSR